MYYVIIVIIQGHGSQLSKVVCPLWVSGETHLQVEEFKYLGVFFTTK